MHKLKIEKLAIRIETKKGLYGTDITFDNGLNIIFAKNTKGKSTCMQAMIFALGLEKSFSSENPDKFLKDPLQKELKDENNNTLEVESSYVYIEIINRKKEKITLRRYCYSDNKEKNKIISVFENKNISNVLNTEQVGVDYYTGKDSYIREKGFHKYLANFLGINLPKIFRKEKTSEKEQSIIYLHEIFCASYVEQSNGWSDIFQKIKKDYNTHLKDGTKKVIEYILKLEVAKNRAETTKCKIEIEKQHENYQQQIEKIILLANDVRAEINAKQEKITKTTKQIDNFLYFDSQDNQRINCQTKIQDLKKELDETQNQAYIKTDKEKESALEVALKDLKEKEKDIEKLRQDLDISKQYKKDISDKISIIEDKILKYQDFQKLTKYGSQEEFEINTKRCRTCNQETEDSLYDQSAKQETKIKNIKDSLKYLNNEKSTFKKILEDETQNTEKKERSLNKEKHNLKEQESIIREIKKSIIDPENTPSREQITREILIEEEIKKLEIAAEKESSLINKVNNAISEWGQLKEKEKKIKEQPQPEEDIKTIKELENYFIENLKNFGYLSTNEEEFHISNENYMPYISNTNRKLQDSASDNIRKQWAYLYSLLMIDEKIDKENNHMGILIMDEPKQHSADKEDFNKFLKTMEKCKESNKQVIITTSEMTESDYIKRQNQKVNIIKFDSYLISKITK